MSIPKISRKQGCIRGVFVGRVRSEKSDGGFREEWTRVNVRCGRWDCPYCGPKKQRRLYARTMKGGLIESAHKDGFRDQYGMKFLTLTYGGNSKMDSSTPEKALIEMNKAFSDLIKDLRYLHGKIEYLKVVEYHQNGFPHFHVILAGDGVRPKRILADIERLWRNKYLLGFVKINTMSSGKNTVSYVLKYLVKGNYHFEGKRRYSASRQALAPPIEKSAKFWDEWNIYWGTSNGADHEQDKDYILEVLESPSDYCPF